MQGPECGTGLERKLTLASAQAQALDMGSQARVRVQDRLVE